MCSNAAKGVDEAEKTALAKQYLDFIKSSQRFYREFILELDRRVGGIEELQRVSPAWRQPGRSSLPRSNADMADQEL